MPQQNETERWIERRYRDRFRPADRQRQMGDERRHDRAPGPRQYQ